MDPIYWLQIMSAVLAANALSLWWGFSMWKITRNEKAGVKPSKGPAIYLVGAIVPISLAGIGVYLLS